MRDGVRVQPGDTVDLGDYPPDATLGLDDKEKSQAATLRLGERLS